MDKGRGWSVWAGDGRRILMRDKTDDQIVGLLRTGARNRGLDRRIRGLMWGAADRLISRGLAAADLVGAAAGLETDSPVFTLLMEAARRIRPETGAPIIVCLCGSTRFKDAFREANLKETLAGKIVLTIGCDTKSDDLLFGTLTKEEWDRTKAGLDALHLWKIKLADEVLILNVDGYIGESTGRELAYARAAGKSIRFLEEDRG